MATPIEDIITNNAGNINENGVAKRFAGFKGRSMFPNRTRIYLNEQLDEYIEVADADKIAEIELAGRNSPLILLIVKRDADVQHVVSLTEQVPASYLSGEITQRHLHGNRMLGNSWFSTNGPVFAPTYNCGSAGMACGSMTPGCGSAGIACGSAGRACGSVMIC